MDLALVGDAELAAFGSVALLLVVWGIVFAESGLFFGFFLPGDTLLFAAGLLVADPATDVPIWLLAGGVVVAAVTGDAVGYWIGRRGGRPMLERREGKLMGTASLRRAETFYDRYGWSAVVAARFVPWVRTAAPLLAGAAHMPYPRFLSANVVGALLWGAGLTTLGWLAYDIPVIRDVAIAVGIGAALLSIIPGVLRYRKVRRARRETAAGTGTEPPTGPSTEPPTEPQHADSAA